jgi:phenol 2-monooxygenase
VSGLIKRKDNHKILVDDESYNYGHGHAYEFLGVDPVEGTVIVIRPDQYVSMVTGLDNVERVKGFFDGFLERREEM